MNQQLETFDVELGGRQFKKGSPRAYEPSEKYTVNCTFVSLINAENVLQRDDPSEIDIAVTSALTFATPSRFGASGKVSVETKKNLLKQTRKVAKPSLSCTWQ